MPPKGQPFVLYDPTGRILKFDSKFKAAIVQEIAHSEIHEGQSFYTFFDNNMTNTGEMTVIAFNLPPGVKRMHVFFFASSTALTQVSLYESPSVDVDEGTQKDIQNRDFNSSNPSQLTSIETTPVANKVTLYDETQAAGANISKTTEKWHEDIGQSGNPATQSGGQNRGDKELILENGKQYAFIAESLDDNDNHVSLIVSWYEHTDE